MFNFWQQDVCLSWNKSARFTRRTSTRSCKTISVELINAWMENILAQIGDHGLKQSLVRLFCCLKIYFLTIQAKKINYLLKLVFTCKKYIFCCNYSIQTCFLRFFKKNYSIFQKTTCCLFIFVYICSQAILFLKFLFNNVIDKQRR